MDAMFQWFDERPLGVASIGQVHRVTLRDGRPAVVKVGGEDKDKLLELCRNPTAESLGGWRT